MTCLIQFPPKVTSLIQSESQCPKHGQWGPTFSAHHCCFLDHLAQYSSFSLSASVASASSTQQVSYHLWDFVFFVPSALNTLPPSGFMTHFLPRLTQRHCLGLTLSGRLLPTPPTIPGLLSYFILFSLIFSDSNIVFCMGFPLDYECQWSLWVSMTHSQHQEQPLTQSTYSTNA